MQNLRQLIACETLRKEGYVIIERNFRSRSGSIAVVAREGGQLVFVDVSGRQKDYTTAQQNRLRTLAREYVQQRQPVRDGVRFDHVAVRLRKGELARVSVTPHVFYQGVI